MASHNEGFNPLRPYYIPPSIGDAPDVVAGAGRHRLPHANASSPYAHKARDIFADLDYKDYIAEPSPSMVQSARNVVDELLWRYTSVLMAQPFEVAKTVLQISSQDTQANPITQAGPDALTPAVILPDPEPSRRHRSRGWGADDPYADYDSDPDEPSYFTPSAPNTSSPLYPASRTRRAVSPYGAPMAAAASTGPQLAETRLVLQKADSILGVISQLWQTEGAWGVWKGTNASFLYAVLQSLLENWSRSLLSALFNVPDLGLKDDVDRLIDIASPYPWASLFVAAAAAVTAGLILSPLDLVRTRLIITPINRQPRRVLSIIRSLPSYVCSPVLVLSTVLHSLIHPLLTLSTPLVLRTRFMIDKDVNPVAFSITKFCSSSLALFVKLPLETVLRRGQASVLNSPEYVHAIEPVLKVKPRDTFERPVTMQTIIALGHYNGVVGTMTHIVLEEGTSSISDSEAKARVSSKKSKPKTVEAVCRRGQGMEGLWRGWKVSWWGLVGLWTAAALSGGGDGEF